jgi:cytoskeleton protein RodZ
MAQQREPIVSLFQRIKAPFTESGEDEIASAMPGPRPVGEMLRERREELHLDIDDIGEVLRIKPAFLAALEQSRPQDLPGPTYVIGFVRAYARHLGLDHDWVLERYKAESTGVRARPDLTLPVPLGERSVPGGPILLVALILAICGYGTWYYLSTGERARPERVAALPPALQMQPEQAAATPDADAAGSASKPVADLAASANPANPRLSSGLLPGSAGATASEPVATPSAAGPATAAPGPGSSVPAQPPAATAKASAPSQTAMVTPQTPTATSLAGTPTPAPPQTATATPQGPAAPTGDGGNAAAGRIEIRAVADCWVQVRAPDQSIVFSRVLKAGETYRVPARSGLVMRTGNAGALAIAVDGKTVPSLGPAGTLRRNVVLDPAALLGGTAVQG